MKLSEWNGDPDPVMLDLMRYEQKLEQEDREREETEEDDDEGN